MAQLNRRVMDRKDTVMSKISEFFSISENTNKMLPIVKQKANISLRMLDWVVTNYSKKNNVIYDIEESDKNGNVIKSRPFSIYLDYKAQLKSFSKKEFDPFCRRERINFYYEPNSYIVTTVGQLNFFKWAIEHKILEYVADNLKSIEDDMIAATKEKQLKKTLQKTIQTDNPSGVPQIIDQEKAKQLESDLEVTKSIRRRSKLSNNATSMITKRNTKVTISFD